MKVTVKSMKAGTFEVEADATKPVRLSFASLVFGFGFAPPFLTQTHCTHLKLARTNVDS